MCRGRDDSCNVCFPMGSHSQPGEKQRCFPGRALPHLSLLLGLWHRRLRWCPQGCFTGVSYFCTWQGEGSALVPGSPLSHGCHSSQPWMVELRGHFPSFPALLAAAGQEHSHPFTAGQQGNVPILPASQLPSYMQSSPPSSTGAALGAGDPKIAFGVSCAGPGEGALQTGTAPILPRKLPGSPADKEIPGQH